MCIRSTWKGGGLKTISGTSMASPYMAGAATLYKSKHSGATPAQVKAFVLGPANSEAVGQGRTGGFGLDPEPVLQMDNY